MTGITTCLWYDGNAEEAAKLYTSIFPDSAIGAIHRSPADNPGTGEGAVLVVEFTVLGQKFIGLNGGPNFKFDEAVSFQIATTTQEETDRYWNALIADGGAESACGWCKDKFGLSWQITPTVLTDAIANPDKAASKRAFQAMMTMRKIDIAAIEHALRGE